ncbi:MAG: Tm-1-like ATP-binding domain-containing protein [Candidatus Neomarinimicrobiota bacterium]|nr:Tm-1-like ATP-binding domain-containing protein [Candidatus Neomarinimicrobiota bacterium]
MSKVIAILATMDTKGVESDFIRKEIETLGGKAILIDVGVIGEVTVTVDISNDEVARAGDGSMEEILKNPTRQDATPVLIAGSTKIINEKLLKGEVDGLIALGGSQGTTLCAQVMQSLPYGFPKVMLSTVASGDTAPFVDIKDITMMFSVSDILGLNDFSRKILANVAGAAYGMALSGADLEKTKSDKPLIGMSNLGVLTKGCMIAIDRFHEKGYEVVVFHAIGAGGRAMEQMMKEGLIGGVLDYAMGEIADEVYGVLRAGGPERLTVAGKLGLPQVLCPGGAEHLGILVSPNEVPDEWKDHEYVFHSPVVFVPRLVGDEIVRVADDITSRLRHTKGNAIFMLPTDGTGTYGRPGGVLRDTESDELFFDALRSGLPDTIEIVERHTHAEDPEFVRECVDRLIGLIEGE